MNDTQYQMQEITRFHNESQAIETSPLECRKEGARDFKGCLEHNLGHFVQCVSYLIDGSYGAGVQFAFARCSKRMNRRAWLFNHVAMIEFRTSMKYACDTWNKLDTDLQAAINSILDEEIKEYDLDPIKVDF